MIERDLDDGILTLRLAHGRASAMDVELLEGLLNALEEARTVRAVVLTGSGSIFSAGVDLFRLTEGGAEYVQRFFPLLSDFIRRLFALPVPVVAAVNGHAIAGGCLMVMASDYRLMADGTSRIGVPELTVGVPFPAAALELVRYAVPADRIQTLVYGGRAVSPQEALAHGLVDAVVAPELLAPRARDAAEQLAALAPDAFRLTKALLRRPTLERMAAAVEHDAAAFQLWSSPDTHQRIRDYLARTVRR
jgi:enoyl-CoA hydratase